MITAAVPGIGVRVYGVRMIRSTTDVDAYLPTVPSVILKAAQAAIPNYFLPHQRKVLYFVSCHVTGKLYR